MSIVLAGILIAPIYTKWRTQPTYTSVAGTNYPIWNIDFPAVTVCSNIKVLDSKLKKAIKKKP